MYPASQGKVSMGLAELVDVYPTLAELAGTPTPHDHLDGVSLVPFIKDHTLLSFPTPRGQGTLNKTVAFSQYPHAVSPIVPALSCPYFYRANATCGSSGPECWCHQQPQGGSRGTQGGGGGGGGSGAAAGVPAGPPEGRAEGQAAAPAAKPAKPAKPAEWMGFSVRDQGWRYTAWIPYNGTRAQWPASFAPDLVQELYDHRLDDGTDFNAMDTANLAYNPAQAARVAAFFQTAREYFDVIAPPTSRPPQPTPVGRTPPLSLSLSLSC